MMSQINIKFLVDVNIGRSVEEWLLANGYDMKAVRDINPRMLDRDILKIAVSENRMVITMDRDFGELVYNSGMPHSGVLLLRLEDATANEKVEILEKILILYPDKLLNNFCVFQHGKIRIRK
jgi:predicted nuclease of predicted toxin-antitoxin system